MPREIRVLHAPTTVGGNPQGLARAERQIGLKSWSLTYFQNYYQYPADEVLCENGNRLLFELKRLALYIKAITRYDIVHYNSGQTLASPVFPPDRERTRSSPIWVQWLYYHYTKLLNDVELQLFRRLRKPIFITFQGDDARQGDFCLRKFSISAAAEVEKSYYTRRSDEEKRKRIAQFEKFAAKIYALNPDLLHVLPASAEFLPYAHIDLNSWTPTFNSSGKIKLIHAPSHRGVKGTRYVIDAISRLKQEGFDFSFELIEGLSNRDARSRYEAADILIDQLLVGWYGGLALELMALGKPVVCYIREGDLKYIPNKMREELPIINANPDTIYSELKKLIVKPRSELIQLGNKARLYVEKWHDPVKIASRLKKDYETAISNRLKLKV
jgi:glycosyltransferase involved in cell wall biosynthesis